MAGSRDAGTSGAGAVPVRSAQMMEEKEEEDRVKETKRQCVDLIFIPKSKLLIYRL